MKVWYLTAYSKWNNRNNKGILPKRIKKEQNIFEMIYYRRGLEITEALVRKIKNKKWKEKYKGRK